MEDYEPRPKASQAVAAQKRRERQGDTETAPVSRQPSNALPLGVGAVLLLALIVGIAHQFATTPALHVPVPTATSAPSALARQKVLFAVPTSTPVLAELPRAVPPVAPEPSGDVPAVSQEVPPPIVVVDPPVEIAPPPVEVVEVAPPPPAPTAAPEPLRIRAEDDCASEHGRCPPCTAEHGRCQVGDQ